MPFKIGQSVLCIDDGGYSPKDRFWVKEFPVAGQRYTIRKMAHGYRGLGVWLVEITNPQIPVVGLSEKMEPIFLATRFRAIDESASPTSQAVTEHA